MVGDGAGLTARGLGKHYDGTWVLQDVNLSLQPGTVVALVGHNGAGKSTLLRALSGVERPDEGSIWVDGHRLTMTRPADATDAGIACVYQELSLVDQLTVAQNLFLGREMQRGGLLTRRAMMGQADRLCEEFGIPARGADNVGELTIAVRQMVEVMRAVHRGSRYLLLDEPTTALEQAQIERLLTMIQSLATDRGIGVLLVDHKLDEVFAVAQRVIALSNGRVVLEGTSRDVDRAAVIQAVVGRDIAPLETTAQADAKAIGRSPTLIAEDDSRPVVFSAEHVSGPRLTDVSVRVVAHQILGVYGLAGAGRSRFLRTVYGVEPLLGGTMRLDGIAYIPRTARYAISQHIALVPEERKRDGLIPMMTGRDNAALPVLDRFQRLFMVLWARIHAATGEATSQVAVRGDTTASVSRLSGGNQQKIMFARAVLQRPRLLLLDEPTKGVDIGAKAEIHTLIRSLANDGDTAVLVVSSEEEELLQVADAVVVFRGGVCDGQAFDVSSLTQARLRELAWMSAGAVG